MFTFYLPKNAHLSVSKYNTEKFFCFIRGEHAQD